MRLALTLSWLCALLLCPAAAAARSGDLDPSFSGDGKLVSALPIYSAFDHQRLAPDAEGNLYVRTGNLVRLLPDGTLDAGFSSPRGLRTSTCEASGTPIHGFYFYDTQLSAIALQPDGDLVASCTLLGYDDGEEDIQPQAAGVSVADPADVSVPTFPLLRAFGVQDWAGELAVSYDGSAAVSVRGFSLGHYPHEYQDSEWRTTILRLNEDGSTDARFRPVVLRRTHHKNPHLQQLAFQPQGGLLVLLKTGIVRLRPNGKRDRKFGKGGVAPGSWSRLVVDEKGRMVAVGAKSKSGRAHVTRLTVGGHPDSSFGRHGKASPRLGTSNGEVVDLTVGPDHGVILAVRTSGHGKAGKTFRLIALNGGGNTDRSFGHGGRVSTRFPHPVELGELAFDGQHRLFAGGRATVDKKRRLVVAAYKL